MAGLDKEMSDEELVEYAAIHCKTDRALFSKEHVFRLERLGGIFLNLEFLPDFISIGEEVMMPIVAAARLRMFSPGPYSNTGR